MAFAMPLAASNRSPRPQLLVRLLPGVLLCAGSLLLTQPWNEPASPAGAGAKGSDALATLAASDPLASSGLDPAAILGALLVVGGLLFFLPAVVRRLSPGARSSGAINVVESRPIGGRKALLLVEVAGRRLLIGVSEQGLAPLAELGDSGELAAEPAASRFAGAFARELAAPVAPAPALGNPA